MRSLYASSALSLLAILLSGGMTSICYAETAESKDTSSPAADSQLEEIVVTANKRAESVNKVGISITAVTGDALLQSGVSSPADLAKVVPGFYFTQSLYGTPVFTMRGVGFNTTSLGISPAVSVYVDEVPLPFPAMTPGASLDVSRLEAIKGPQGVLFGNNSTGGAINYIAESPTPDYGAGGSLTYASFNRFDGQGYLSGPLSDTVSGRLSVRAEEGGAWQVSQTRPSDKLGDANRLFGRLLFDFTPNSRLNVRLNINGWQDKSENQARRAVAIFPLISGAIIGLPQNAFVPAGLLAVFPPPADGDRAADWDPNRSFRNDKRFLQGSIRAGYELTDNVKLTSISAYSYLRPNSVVDTDGTAFNSVSIIQRGSVRAFFQEVRADNQLSDRASLLIGVNYERALIRDSLTADVNASIYNLFLGQPHGIDDTHVDTDADTYAAFSKLDYRFTDSLKLIGAVRFTDDRRSAALCTYDVGGAVAELQNIFSGTSLKPGDCITATKGVPGIVHDKLDQNNVSWRLGAEWQSTPDTLFYATANRGFKAGGFPNVFAFDSSQLKPVVQEELQAYEIGSKLTLFSHRLQFNADVFHYDYTNKQIQGRIIVGPLGALETLVNVPKSKVDGAEFQATAVPVSGVSLKAALSYVDSKIGSGTFAYTPFGNYPNVGGQHFPATPMWQANLDAGYEHPVSSDLTASVGASLVYTGANNAAFGDLPVFDVPGYSIVDARIGIGSVNHRWQATLFVRNLTDKTYFYSTQQTIDVLTRYYGQPRTFGVTLQGKY